MSKKLNLEEDIIRMEVNFEDLSDLEEMVTPGFGTGCNCADSQ